MSNQLSKTWLLIKVTEVNTDKYVVCNLNQIRCPYARSKICIGRDVSLHRDNEFVFGKILIISEDKEFIDAEMRKTRESSNTNSDVANTELEPTRIAQGDFLSAFRLTSNSDQNRPTGHNSPNDDGESTERPEMDDQHTKKILKLFWVLLQAMYHYMLQNIHSILEPSNEGGRTVEHPLLTQFRDIMINGRLPGPIITSAEGIIKIGTSGRCFISKEVSTCKITSRK